MTLITRVNYNKSIQFANYSLFRLCERGLACQVWCASVREKPPRRRLFIFIFSYFSSSQLFIFIIELLSFNSIYFPYSPPSCYTGLALAIQDGPVAPPETHQQFARKFNNSKLLPPNQVTQQHERKNTINFTPILVYLGNVAYIRIKCC